MITETEMTIEQSIKKEIAKFDPFEARLIELKEQYSGLTIAGVEDKEGYETVRQAIAELRGIRTGTTKDKAVIKKPFLDACSTIEEKSKWIIAEVSKIEDPLQAQKDSIDAEKEKIKAQKKAAQEAVFIKRSMQLSNMGAIFDGTNFILEDASYEGVLVREADDDVYEEFILPKFKAVFDKRELVRLEEERVRAELVAKEQAEREEFAKAQEDLKRKEYEIFQKQAALEERRLEAERKEKEAAELANKEWNDAQDAQLKARMKQLYDLGLTYNFQYDSMVFEDVNVHQIEITGKSAEEWDTIITTITPVVAERKKVIAAKIAAALEEQNKFLAEAAAKKERERIEAEQKATEIKRQQEEARKAEELAKAGDKANWADILRQLNNLVINDMKSGQYRKKLSILKEKIEEINQL